MLSEVDHAIERSVSGSVSPRTRARTTCKHCGLPNPASDEDWSKEFCCSGCRLAYQIIHENGLDDFYSLQEDLKSRPSRVSNDDHSFEEFDNPAFESIHVRATESDHKVTRLVLEHVHCAACLWLLEQLPRIEEGVVSARLHLARSTLDVEWDPGITRLSSIGRALSRLGYCPHPGTKEESTRTRQREDRASLGRIAVAGACAGNNMLIALAIYAGEFSGMADDYLQLFRWVSTILGMVALTWPGSVFFRGAWTSLRTGRPHLDVPLALGLGVGAIAGVVNTFLGTGGLYFDSLSVLILLLLVGRFLQQRQHRWAADRLDLMRALTPQSVRRCEGETTSIIPIEALRVDDIIELRPGEVFPADGIVLEGESTIDQSLLTGEPDPIAVAVGDPVLAGVGNLTSILRVRVTAVAEETRAGRLFTQVEELSSQRVPIVEWAHRVSGVFVAVVLVLALITLAIWWPSSPRQAIENAVALLVVSCPCALGLATPLAIAVAQGRAAARSILIKNGEAIQQLSKPGRIWLDKTGTLTIGRCEVRRWFGDQSLLPVIAALESNANHPLARAVTRFAREELGPRAVECVTVAGVRQIVGAGVVGWVNGAKWEILSPSYAKLEGLPIPEDASTRLTEMVSMGLTPALVFCEGLHRATIGFGDELKADAKSVVERLQSRGWDVGILSGDQPTIVANMADRLGIPRSKAMGGLSPENKLDFVRYREGTGRVVMLGDGINDGAALAAADIGIAIHGGAELSLKCADIYLGSTDLSLLDRLMDGCRDTMTMVQRNLAFSLVYNSMTIGLAMAGYVNPLTAAILMPISSLTIVGMTMSVPVFGGKR